VSDTEVQSNPIEDLIQSALTQNYAAATDIFNDTIGQKMQAALEQEKIGIADQIFNGAEPEEITDEDDEESTEDEDIDDSDVEEIYNELDDEEIEEDDE